MSGYALIQKSYDADFLDKRQRKNKGEVQQYYVTGGHEAKLCLNRLSGVFVCHSSSLQRERHSVLIQVFQDIDKGGQALPAVCLVGTQDA